MDLTEKHIEEIAEELECGMVCFYHRSTGAIECYPDPDSFYSDDDDNWNEIIEKIEGDRDNYIRFEKMDSTQSFSIMESFAITIEDDVFKNKLEDILSDRQPFSNFKEAIDRSTYRGDWFAYKRKAYIDWVRKEISQ